MSILEFLPAVLTSAILAYLVWMLAGEGRLSADA